MANRDVNDRVTVALTTLKNELVELRNHDVELMKQLLYISNTIQTIKKKHGGHKRHSKTTSGYQRRCFSSYIIPVATENGETWTNERTQSTPDLEISMGSCSSLEGSISSDDVSEFSENDDDLYTQSPKPSRQPSLSFIKDSDSNISDEDILRTNIRMWKHSKTDMCS